MGSRQRRFPHLPLSLRHGWVPFVLVSATVSVATLATAPASAAKRTPTPSYRTAFNKLDLRWRHFILAQKTLAKGNRPHLCASAQKHVDIANRLMPKGDDALNDGMARLKSLR